MDNERKLHTFCEKHGRRAAADALGEEWKAGCVSKSVMGITDKVFPGGKVSDPWLVSKGHQTAPADEQGAFL